jgi:hypothetical protein
MMVARLTVRPNTSGRWIGRAEFPRSSGRNTPKPLGTTTAFERTARIIALISWEFADFDTAAWPMLLDGRRRETLASSTARILKIHNGGQSFSARFSHELNSIRHASHAVVPGLRLLVPYPGHGSDSPRRVRQVVARFTQSPSPILALSR